MGALMRVGVPQTGGRILAGVRERAHAALVSAGAFARKTRSGGVGLSLSRVHAFDGMDVALDSAGFTAMRLWGEYPWSMDAYLELAAARPWAWYAAMDYCCEREIAGDEVEVLFRIAATAQAYARLAALARGRAMELPMPVLQGDGEWEDIDLPPWS